VSRKSERLVNLTIALLATKRYLTKSEIFRSIEGYDGSEDSIERMFERDKDDLRSLGIEIEVGGLDPLFNDEAGYRIKPENYSLDLGPVTGEDIALLSLAAQAWKGQALNDVAHSVLLKLQSMGIDSDIDSIPNLVPRMAWASDELATVLDAITTRNRISFTYLSPELAHETREISPYALASSQGHWYFGGLDNAKQSLRTFRLDRVFGEIENVGKPDNYEIPSHFDLFASSKESSHQQIAILDIRKDKAFALRKISTDIQDKGEWDRITLNYLDPSSFLDSILWHLDDVIVIEPDHLRKQVIDTLTLLVEKHG
jgi:proteasome accessory factor B